MTMSYVLLCSFIILKLADWVASKHRLVVFFKLSNFLKFISSISIPYNLAALYLTEAVDNNEPSPALKSMMFCASSDGNDEMSISATSRFV